MLNAFLTMSLFDLDDLPFEFRALELALELTCLSLDAQVMHISIFIWNMLHLCGLYQSSEVFTNLVYASFDR